MADIYEVFISFKNTDGGKQTRDSEIAQDLYDEFHRSGVHAFFSNVKLLELGSAAYKSSIEKAIDQANVMVVVGTCIEYLETEWVTYERESFHNDILSGIKKNACIVPYLGNIDGNRVPRSLRGYETFSTNSHSVKDVVNFVLNFLKNSADSKASEPPKSVVTGMSASAYRADGGREFRRLKIQSDYTRPADIPAIEHVLKEMGKSSVKILDAGCAYGFVTKDRFEKIPDSFTIGLDFNEKCLDYARKNNSADNLVYEYCNFEAEDMEEKIEAVMQKYGVESFDIIFSSLVIHHLRNPNKFLKRIRRYLAKDGYIILRGSDDGSIVSVNDDGLIQKIVDLHMSTEGVSDRHNGRKIYAQLLSSGYKNVKMMNYVKEISGMDIDERNDIFEERFAYRRNYLKALSDKNPYDLEKKNNLEYMDFALECLENKFSEDAFWYCEIDFVGVAQKK